MAAAQDLTGVPASSETETIEYHEEHVEQINYSLYLKSHLLYGRHYNVNQ